MSWAWSDWPFTQFPNCTFSVLWHCWLSHLTREWCVRELHGDKSLSPSPTVPVVPFPIPTPSPQTRPPSPPRPHTLCPHPTPSPLFLSPFPSQSPCYKISLTQCTNHQIISQYFSLANVHLTVSCLFHNIKFNIKVRKEVHSLHCTVYNVHFHGQSQSPCRKSSPSTEGPDSCDRLSSSVRPAREKDLSDEVLVAGTPKSPRETRATASKQ